MPWLFVCLGAAVGAPARYLVDQFVRSHHGLVLPWGTLIVNVAGSLLLGFLAGLAPRHGVSAGVYLAAGPGFCGSLTTYSTLMYETLRLLNPGSWPYAFANVAANLSAGTGGALLGYAVGASL